MRAETFTQSAKPWAPLRQAGGFLWLMAHEARLSLRSLPGNSGKGLVARNRTLLFWSVLLSLLLHAIAVPFSDSLRMVPDDPEPARLMTISFFILIGFAILVARSLDGVTQLLFSRADLDLLLSSPLPPRRVFSARLVAVATQTIMPALFFTAPFAHVAALRGDPRWLALYPLAFALVALSTTLAAMLATGLFTAIGARRTRIAAQVVATLLATGIGVGAQISRLLPIAYQDWLSQIIETWSQSSAFAASSPLVWPTRALLGAYVPLLQLLGLAALVFAFTGRYLAGRLAANALLAMSADMGTRDRGRVQTVARRQIYSASSAAVLRRKEWLLALRSPWLIAELLTPLVYLVPPVLALSTQSGDATPPLWLMASALTMLACQLAAGVSRLMISGEDAPELVATAPVTQGARDGAKIVAVISLTSALMLAPLALVLWHSAYAGMCGLVGSLAAMLAVCAIHLWFRTEGRRQSFYGRTKVPFTVSVADQLIGLLLAATAGFAIRDSWLALATLAGAAALLLLAWHRRNQSLILP